MRHGWVYIYEIPPPTARFDELIEHLESRGLSLPYPATGAVIRLSPVGDQIMTTREELRNQFSDSSEVPFNFYLDSSTNVFCSLDEINRDNWREGYSLDGNTEEQSHFAINMLADLFAMRAAQGTAFAFVADRYAELHRDFHWDDFVLGKVASPPEWPMLLGFSKSFEKTRTVPRHLYRVEELPNCIMFSKK